MTAALPNHTHSDSDKRFPVSFFRQGMNTDRRIKAVSFNLFPLDLKFSSRQGTLYSKLKALQRSFNMVEKLFWLTVGVTVPIHFP